MWLKCQTLVPFPIRQGWSITAVSWAKNESDWPFPLTQGASFVKMDSLLLPDDCGAYSRWSSAWTLRQSVRSIPSGTLGSRSQPITSYPAQDSACAHLDPQVVASLSPNPGPFPRRTLRKTHFLQSAQTWAELLFLARNDARKDSGELPMPRCYHRRFALTIEPLTAARVVDIIAPASRSLLPLAMPKSAASTCHSTMQQKPPCYR